MIETVADVNWLASQASGAVTPSNLMRIMITYLAEHPVNAQSWRLSGVNYQWDLDSLLSRVNRYVTARLAELRGETPEVTFKGEDVTAPGTLQRTIDRLQKVVDDWDNDAEQLHMAEEISIVLACYHTKKEVDELLRKSLLTDTCEQSAQLVKQVIDIIKGKEKPMFIDETLEMLNVLEEECVCTEQEIESGFNALTIAEDVVRFIQHHILTVGHYDDTDHLVGAAKIMPTHANDYTSIRAQLILVREYIERRTKKLQEVEKEETMNNEVEMVECEYCNQKHPIDECTQLSNGNYVCESCKEDHYFTCDECGDLHCDEDGHWIESEEIQVCHRCYDRLFTTCEGCGQSFRHSDMTEADDGEYYCESCYEDRFTTCDHCGCEVYRDDAYWTDNDECLCESCYDRYTARHVIHDYHDDDVDFSLNTYNGEPINDRTLTIGIEHEVGGDQSYAEGFNEIVNDRFEECNVALFRDSSVDGFEIVSMPMTIEYFKHQFLPVYKKGLQYLKDHNFKGYNEGGIHIHFTMLEDNMQIARLCNILYGSIDDITAWTKITKRDRYEMDRWCSMKDRKYSTVDILRDGLKKCTSNRHTALNCDEDRTCTHELRIFNSTLDIDEYATCVEVLLSLLNFIELDTGKGAYVTTRDWVQYVMDYKDCYTLVHKRLLDEDIYSDYGFDEADYIVPSQDYELTPQDEQMIDDVVSHIFTNLGDLDIDEGDDMIQRRAEVAVG